MPCLRWCARWRRYHDVSILIGAGAGVGRCFGSQPRAKVSMTIMDLGGGEQLGQHRLDVVEQRLRVVAELGAVAGVERAVLVVGRDYRSFDH